MSALFVVFSINLLSRPEREWEGMPRKGVAEPNWSAVHAERKHFSQAQQQHVYI